MANEMVAFIRSHNDGLKNAEIVKRFGKTLPSIKAFLGQYASGVKITTTGVKAPMVYHAERD